LREKVIERKARIIEKKTAIRDEIVRSQINTVFEKAWFKIAVDEQASKIMQNLQENMSDFLKVRDEA
jgi:hypothetical protein